MAFGQRKAEAPSPSMDQIWMRTFQTGETTVRFIDEIDEWIAYKEHFKSPENHWFPCTQDSECIGCNSDDEKTKKRSTRYATNAYFVKESTVRPVKVPVTLASRLETRSERNDGTITNRDYVIIKSGSGLNTEYDVDQDSRYEAPLEEYRKQAHDIEDILQTRYEEITEQTKTDEKFESKEKIPFDQGSAQVVLDEASVRSMSLRELKDLAVDAGVDLSSVSGKEDIADLLVGKLK